MIPPLRSRTGWQIEEANAEERDWLEANGMTEEELDAKCKQAEQDVD